MKSVYLLFALLLTASRMSASNVSAPGHALTHASASMDAQLSTAYGTKPPSASANTTVAPSTATAARPITNDLLIALALMSIPVTIVCAIHLVLACHRLGNKKQPETKEHPAFLSPDASVALDPPDPCEYANPATPRRPKSKSVTWQSPFETKARPSHRTTTAHSAMAAGELHFVLVTTPDKWTSSRVSRGVFRPRRSERPSEEPIPKYRLDRLDSSPREDDVAIAPSRSSSLSLGASPVRPQHEPTTSPVAMLHDSGVYDSDSPRNSMSSANSDDPEILRKLDDAMRWTQMSHGFDGSPESSDRPTRAMRSSSSLDDFRHDLHHEHDEHDPDQITRSSEYSF